MEALPPPATTVPELLAAGPPAPPDPTDYARRLVAARGAYGISRVGSVTRLDRIGIPVVQAVRPLALSNAVNQGKGETLAQATISAVMEAIETWAAERVPEERVVRARAGELDPSLRPLYGVSVVEGARAHWEAETLPWVAGWDLLGEREVPVPLALVDTRYTLPSHHPVMFPRTTTGLATGPNLAHALLHAALEVLEKDAVAAARRRPFFFERWGILPDSVDGPRSAAILRRIEAAGLICGIWQVPADHALPVYWCRIMDASEEAALAPLPADGYGCDFTHDDALAKALLEACQGRVGAVAGAREDITRSLYRTPDDGQELASWRAALLSREGRWPFRPQPPPDPARAGWRSAAAALAASGASAALVVPLHAGGDPPVAVLRLVVPELRHGDRP
jgi:ribosomal protein S12 methylthiotransferase accessory factor